MFLDPVITKEELEENAKMMVAKARGHQHRVIDAKGDYPATEFAGKIVKVLDVPDNLEFLLKKFNAKIRLNLMTRQREISIPGHFISKEDKANAELNLITSLAIINYLPTRLIDNHLDTIAQKNAYHPIVECRKNNPWDGERRLQDFARKTIKTYNPDLAEKIIITWMVAAMAAAHSENGFINSGVLVLQGKQSIGKTSWLRRLDPINCGAVRDGAFLDPSNKDSVIQLASYWIAELAEVETIFKKSEIGRLKSFITMQSDFVRAPYARKAVCLPRRTVYAATVNESNYLTDETGNRRWWTIPVIEVDYQHDFDMVQVWAEVYTTWKAGHPTYLTSELQAAVNSANKEFERIDPIREKLLSHYDWEATGRRYKSATQILEEIGIKNPTMLDARRLSLIVKDLNNGDRKISKGLTRHAVPNLIRVGQEND